MGNHILYQAVVVALPTVIDLKHAVEIYGAIFGCAVSLWIVSAVVGKGLDLFQAARDEQRAYVIRRLMEGDGKR